MTIIKGYPMLSVAFGLYGMTENNKDRDVLLWVAFGGVLSYFQTQRLDGWMDGKSVRVPKYEGL